MAVQLSPFEAFTAPDDPSKQIISTSERFERLVRFLENRPWLVVDYETSGTAWYKHARAVGIGLGSWDDEGRFWSAYVPFRHRTREPQLDLQVISPAIQTLLGNDSLKIAHNIKFEDHMSRREGWVINGPRYDTMITAHIHDENRYLDLEGRAANDLGLGQEAYEGKRLIMDYAKQLAKQNKMGVKRYLWHHGYEEVPVQLCGWYCCIDLHHTGALYKFYEETPRISQRFPRIHSTEMALTEVLTDTEQTGLLLDVPYLQTLHSESGQEMQRLEVEFDQALHGHGFNMGSDVQLRKFMVDVLKLTWDKTTKSGALSVDADVLQSFIPQFPILQFVLDWRDQQKINTTYSDNLIALCDANGYLHGDLRQVGANTGRLSCRDPNYQNMPNGPLVRQAFLVRGKGWVRLFLDYSQIELRVLAFYSKDPVMLEVYLNNGDIHKATQAGVTEMLDLPEILPRRVAKIINFGLCLEGGQRVLTRQSGLVPIEDVQDWHEVWDGIEWVAHDGVVCRGECEVVEYDGISATPEHEVFTQDGRKVQIGDLASQICDGRIAVGAVGENPVRFVAYDQAHPDAVGEWPQASRSLDAMHGVREAALGFGGQPEGRQDYELLVSEEVRRRSSCEDVGPALRRYGAALQSGYARFVEALQGSRHQGALQVAGAFHPMGSQEVARLGLPEFGVRPHQQRWALQSKESSPDDVQCEHPKRKALVYDILNAGPRHRFTIEGKVVSNSYGMTEYGLSHQAGVPEEQGRAFLSGFFQKFRRVDAYRMELWTYARQNFGSWSNLFGRRRTIPYINIDNVPDYMSGQRLTYKQKQRVVARCERQMIASAIQGTAAELTKESMVRISRWLKSENIPALICNTVHDEIQIDLPKECLPHVLQGCRSLMEYYPEFHPIPIQVGADVTDTNWGEKMTIVDHVKEEGEITLPDFMARRAA